MVSLLTTRRRGAPQSAAPRIVEFETQRRRSRLAAEISIALAVKFALLYVLWAAFFAEPQSRDLDAGTVAAALLRPPPSSDQRAAP